MTDPVTNVEIEDVLSSIRRLVSEKGRSDAPLERTSPKPVVADRLVLTPALRVAEPVTEADTAEDEAETEALVTEDVSGLVEAEIEAEAEAEAETEAETGTDDEAGPDDLTFTHRNDWVGDQADFVTVPAAEAQVTPEPEEEPVEADMPEVSEEVAEEDPALETQDLPEQELVRDAIPGALSADLESRIAKWEAVVATADENYEPARAGEDDYAGTEVESLPWQDHSDPVTEYQGDIRGHETDIAAAEQHPEDAETLRADEMVVEAVADDVTGQVQDVLEEALLDEEALRDLVGEIVRQELQGALGERITRNVRKLVRREIHRALSASGLD